ncbi:hypothetical protein JGY90_10245 [Staphylococcus xylosus]|nr:hypothetical protein [Staphylococcus xylosus]UBV34083.1 hypothetical protein JGY90_10245 [Staphylococcus xylosus]
MIKKEYAFELEKELNSFVRKVGVTVLNISCYFDGSTETHVAIVHYKE